MNVRWLSLGVLLGFLASTAVSCGGASKCSPANCPFGCCDSAGTCQSTVSNAQCGTNAAACVACPFGTTCSLGVCSNITGGTGGSSGGGGGSTGGGGGSTGGGGGSTGGGGGSTANPCAALAAANTSFFGGRSTCSFELAGVGTVDLEHNTSLEANCNAAIGQCSSADRTLLSSLATCIAGAPVCTVSNQDAAGNAFFGCMGDASGLSSGCQSAINPGTGGGGGSTGGGGGTTGCRDITSLGVNQRAGYVSQTNFEFTTGTSDSSTATPMDHLAVEVIWAVQGAPTGVTVPGVFDLAQVGTYNTCATCVVVCEGCTQASGSGCTKCFLARQGTLSVGQATRATPGTFQATVTNLRAEAWNLETDQPITGGGCVTVSSASISATF